MRTPASGVHFFAHKFRNMKFRILPFAALLMASGLASAAPQIQTCEPMEVTHSGGAGLGYSLSCEAGPWRLTYKGSVPAGSSSVLAQYRVAVTHPDGTNLVQTRTARLAEPSQLGQVLLREAVLLDNGNVALRDCPEIGCTLYRPLGGDSKLSKASITVTPEMARLLAERKELTERVESQMDQISALQAREAALAADLSAARQTLESAQAEHAADFAGLESSYSSKLAVQRAEDSAAAASAQKTNDELMAQVQSLTAQLASVRQELDKTTAAAAAAQAQLHDAHSARQDLQGQVHDAAVLAQAHAGELATATATSAERERALIQTRAELDQAKESIVALTRAVAESDSALVDMTEQRNAALVNVKHLGETTLEVLDKYDALKTDYDASQASLQAAQKDAADLYTKLEAAKLTQDLAGQAASVAHLEVDSLNLQVQGLTAELGKAIEVLTAAKKEGQAYQAETEGLRGENTALSAQLTAAKQLESDLQAQLDAANATIAELRATSTDQFNKSGETVGRLHDQVESCKAAVTALEATNHKIFEDLEAARERLSAKPTPEACETGAEAK